jgi:hypothetical protein
MGLAAPLGLFLLALVAIPLWIHRVRKKTLVTRKLPTIRLLARAAEQQRKRASFRDPFLLYARIAMACLVAFALAKPYLSRLASYASERPVALAIILDDSMSMSRRHDRTRTMLEAAALRAEQVVSELAPDSEVSLVLGGREARLWIRREKSLPALRERLRNAPNPGARGTDLPRALELALNQLGASSLSTREVLVLSDCDKHAGASSLSSPQVPIRVECLKPRKSPPNAYISELQLSTPGDTAESSILQLTLRSASQVGELSVAVRIDGTFFAEVDVPLENGTGVLELPIAPGELAAKRVLGAEIRSPNAIGADDARELRLGAEGVSHVLLVDGDPAPSYMDDELRYVSLALSLSESAGKLHVTRIDADGLDATSLRDFDVVILGNVRAPQGATAEELRHFAERGGGLLIGAGNNVDAFAYRSAFGDLLPAVVRSSAPADPPATLGESTASEMLPDGARGLETARTWKRLLMETPGPGANVVIAFADGSPLLVTAPHGAGRVALFATTFDDAWTDIPLTPGFLPLLHDVMRAISPTSALPPGPHVAGSQLMARVPGGTTRAYMLTPDGRRVDLSPVRDSVRIDDTKIPGIYRVFAPDRQASGGELAQLSFTVLPDLSDSDDTPGSAPSVAERKAQAGVGHPRGVDPWFWLLLGFAFLVEGLLRRQPEAPARAA